MLFEGVAGLFSCWGTPCVPKASPARTPLCVVRLVWSCTESRVLRCAANLQHQSARMSAYLWGHTTDVWGYTTDVWGHTNVCSPSLCSTRPIRKCTWVWALAWGRSLMHTGRPQGLRGNSYLEAVQKCSSLKCEVHTTESTYQKCEVNKSVKYFTLPSQHISSVKSTYQLCEVKISVVCSQHISDWSHKGKPDSGSSST